MQRTLASALPGQVGQTVTIAGWVHRHRRLKSVEFLIVRDRTGLAQVVLPPSAVDAELAGLVEESVVEVTGRVTANTAAPSGVELVDASVRVVNAAQPAPFDLYRPTLAASLPTQLDHAGLALRHPARQTVFRAGAAAVRGFRSTLDDLGFVEVHTPKIVASATESGANVFAIDYFGRPAYLAQSPQFYKQTLVGVFERVYEVGPVFRAEPHDTVRHLAQYTSLDVELGFITDHRDVMAVLRSVLAGMVAAIDPSMVDTEVPEEIPSVHFVDALAMVGAALGEDLSGEPDLAPAHERWLGEWARREYGSDFLFVEGFPAAKRPFYTHP
ncbi:MAG: aspartate--tRNA(Asn) ligase, partial [Micromonosporaceae bacterium]|nr:aspartate--tRNA(Asn) ligase [Micromonosporaceae bacterium]